MFNFYLKRVAINMVRLYIKHNFFTNNQFSMLLDIVFDISDTMVVIKLKVINDIEPLRRQHQR